MAERIFLSSPDVGPDEREALLGAFDSGWIAPVGPALAQFEEELVEYTGAEAAVALSSGTAALHLGLLGVGVRPGDRVVVQTATFAATAFAVMHTGAVPVFCDVEESTWNLDPLLLERWLEDQPPDRLPAAIAPVDLYGLCPNYPELQRVASRFEIPIVEDAAEALGSKAFGQMAGTLGEIGVFSFNGNKIITTSGGGALVGSTEDMDRARFLATQAREPVLHYEHLEIGYNYRMSNLLAALGSAQLNRLERGIERRGEILLAYRDAFPEIRWLEGAGTERPNNWLAVGLLPTGLAPSEVCAELDELDIEARPIWKPMHEQPVFQGFEAIGGQTASNMFAHGICLPSGSGLTDDELSHVVTSVRQALS
ncbi:MAG: aminotransferase class I/II-fold pyridoxal phosphate-dependent enzyme [Actinomycetia bacterium]|nr:aminotransferase class I/II-fold pyridoxal phosphate-dependent enzyme [Actinomycetes bacterium]